MNDAETAQSRPCEARSTVSFSTWSSRTRSMGVKQKKRLRESQLCPPAGGTSKLHELPIELELAAEAGPHEPKAAPRISDLRRELGLPGHRTEWEGRERSRFRSAAPPRTLFRLRFAQRGHSRPSPVNRPTLLAMRIAPSVDREEEGSLRCAPPSIDRRNANWPDHDPTLATVDTLELLKRALSMRIRLGTILLRALP